MHCFQVRNNAYYRGVNHSLRFLRRSEICDPASPGLQLHLQSTESIQSTGRPDSSKHLSRCLLVHRRDRDRAEHHSELPYLRDRPGELGGLVAAGVVPGGGAVGPPGGPHQPV